MEISFTKLALFYGEAEKIKRQEENAPFPHRDRIELLDKIIASRNNMHRAIPVAMFIGSFFFASLQKVPLDSFSLEKVGFALFTGFWTFAATSIVVNSFAQLMFYTLEFIDLDIPATRFERRSYLL